MITRRTLSKLALGSAFVAQAQPATALFHRRKRAEDWALQLQEEMTAAIRPGFEGRFEVIRFDLQDAPFWAMEASLRLHWPPGVRGHPFLATGANAEEAYAALKTAALAHYRAVWTFGDGTSAIG